MLSVDHHSVDSVDGLVQFDESTISAHRAVSQGHDGSRDMPSARRPNYRQRSGGAGLGPNEICVISGNRVSAKFTLRQVQQRGSDCRQSTPPQFKLVKRPLKRNSSAVRQSSRQGDRSDESSRFSQMFDAKLFRSKFPPTRRKLQSCEVPAGLEQEEEVPPRAFVEMEDQSQAAAVDLGAIGMRNSEGSVAEQQNSYVESFFRMKARNNS